MSISSQLPPLPLAQASAPLRALAQSAGQTVEARVIAQQPNGTTQVQIGRQVMSLTLPTLQVPGTVLGLAVQQAEGQLRLSIVSITPPTPGVTTTVPSATSALAPPSSPATSVQISSLIAAPASPVASAAQSVYGPGAAPVAPQPIAAQQAVPASANAVPVGQVAPQAPPTQGASQAQAPIAPVAAAAAAGVAAGAPVSVAPSVVPTPAVPYAAAAPAAPSVAPPAQPGVSAAMPPVQQATVSTHVGQHSPSPSFLGAGGTPPAVAPATPMASTPQVALAQMVQQSMPSQNSVVALTSTLTAIVGRVALPEAVAKAAQQVLGHRLMADSGRIDGAALQKAIQGSGIFQEASLAAGRPNAAGGDLKTALLGLQQRLGQWLGAQGPVEQVARVPPPLRGITPRARFGEAPPADLPLDPLEVGKMLQEHTHAALSRLRLHQNASLPDTATTRQEAQWSLDLPISTGATQALLQMQIHHDGEGDATRPEDRGWQVRFAINLNDMGEVGAQISMRGKITGVMLWAEQPETADLLAASIAELRGELEAVGLAPGTVMVRTGAPAPAPAPPATHFVDEVR